MSINVSLGLEDTHVVVTGGAGHIGRVVVEAFSAAGAHVSSMDIANPRDSPLKVEDDLLKIYVDTTDEASVEAAFTASIRFFGPPQCLVALAAKDLSVLPHTGLVDMAPTQWVDTLKVNVGGTMMVCREHLRRLRGLHLPNQILNNCSIILVGSESGHFGERTNPDYAASKAAVQGGLLQSLKAEAPRINPHIPNIRVNAIAPGPVDTDRFKQECHHDPNQMYADAQATVALRRPVPVEAVARSVLYLASENFSSHVHGQVLNVDSGKQGKLMWSREEIDAMNDTEA